MFTCVRRIVPLLLMLICGCSLLVKEPQVTVTQTSIIGLDTAGADIECALAISNPNSFDLTLLGYTYDLRVMTLPLASGGIQEPLAIPAGKLTDMRLPIRLKYGDLLEILKRHPDPDQVPYRIQARLHLSTPLGNVCIPVDRSETFKIPEKYQPGYYLKQLLGAISSPR
ncbi:MAG: LEA type 2 family protein [Desulfuromonadales bacterium]|nr:LEA type 2 family protein [Desulfuromonadales bacterium]